MVVSSLNALPDGHRGAADEPCQSLLSRLRFRLTCSLRRRWLCGGWSSVRRGRHRLPLGTHCAGAEHCSDQKCETLRKMHSIMPRSRSHGRVDASRASRPPWDGISTIKCKLLGEDCAENLHYTSKVVPAPENANCYEKGPELTTECGEELGDSGGRCGCWRGSDRS